MRPILTLVIALFAAPLAAQQGAASLPAPVSLTETAAMLARNGVARRDARAVLAAAEILRVTERATPRMQREDSIAGPTGPWDGPLRSASLLRLASRIATDTEDWETAEYVARLLQRPDSVPASRGAAGGPVWADAYLPAGTAATYTIEFEGGQTPNLLKVSAGKPGAKLECALYQSAATEKPVVRVKSLAGVCSLGWNQAARGRMTLRIRNNGRATYYLVSSN